MKKWKRKSYSPEATVDKATEGEKRLSHPCSVHGLSGQGEWFCLLTESSLLPSTPQVLWGMGLADSPQNQIAKELVTAGHEGRWTGTPTPTAAATPKTCPTHFQASKSWCPFQKFLSPSGLSLRHEQIRLTLNSGIWQTGHRPQKFQFTLRPWKVTVLCKPPFLSLYQYIFSWPKRTLSPLAKGRRVRKGTPKLYPFL